MLERIKESVEDAVDKGRATARVYVPEKKALKKGLREYFAYDLRWSYGLIAGAILIGIVASFLSHGWTVWPFVFIVCFMSTVHEAAQRAAIRAFGPAWRIDNGAKLKIAMNFDGNATWNATGTGFHFDDGDPGLEFTVQVGEANQFLAEFRNSARLRMQFPGSMTPDLMLSLGGTGALMDPLLACIRNLR